MSNQIDPGFKDCVMPMLVTLASSIVRIIGLALVSKGAVDQASFDAASTGLVEMVAGGLLYTSAQIWSQIKTRLVITKDVKRQVLNQVETQVVPQVAKQVLTQVKDQVEKQVEKQVARQVPVEVKAELKHIPTQLNEASKN